MLLNKEEIKNYLPQREPFLFVDCVREYESGKSIVAELYLDSELPFFKGHFPDMPIFPGVLAVECLAQTSGLIIALGKKEAEENKLFFLASNNVKFVNVAHAGETLTLKSRIIKAFNGLYQFSVEALSGQKLVAGGTLVLASSENVKL